MAERIAIVGTGICGTKYNLEIHVHRGAGAYICGEETGLIESLEGKRPYPRIKPPYFPAVLGLYMCPTIVNNVETLSNLPWILEHGAQAFTAMVRRCARCCLLPSCGQKLSRGRAIGPAGLARCCITLLMRVPGMNISQTKKRRTLFRERFTPRNDR